MKFLIVGAVTLYSSDIAVLIGRALTGSGCEVEYFELNDDLPLAERLRYVDPLRFDRDGFNRRFQHKVAQFHPDVVFIYSSNWGLYPETLREIKTRYGCKLIIWEGNFYLWKWYQAECIPLYDHFFCLDSHLLPLLKASFAQLQVHFLGGCADPQEHRPLDLSPQDHERYGADVCFIGTPHENRVRLFESLTDCNLRLWGPGWEYVPKLKQFARNEPVYGLKKTKLYNASKIMINLQGTKFQVNGLSVRTFEVPACGGFVITEPKPDLSRFFKLDEEITTFASPEELREKVAYYLDHPAERKALTERARNRVLAEHTYQHRAEQILHALRA